MALTCTVLFGVPQTEIVGHLRAQYSASTRAEMVTGFATPEGVEALRPAIEVAPGKLSTFVIGGATAKGFDALDALLGIGVPDQSLYVHLGHSASSGTNKHPFLRYHPMLHSKVYLFELPNRRAVAFVGSHNLTGFALLGLNGEASVMLEGEASDPEFDKIRSHVLAARHQSVRYDTTMKDAYVWWLGEFMDGLKRKIEDKPREFESARTVILLAESDSADPTTEDVIYFELPRALHQIRALGTEVHLYIFDKLPATPQLALATLGSARAKYLCKTEGLELQGGLELDAQWEVRNPSQATIVRVTPPFRPLPAADQQQVRVKPLPKTLPDYEYFFTPEKADWVPAFETAKTLEVSREHRQMLEGLSLYPSEHRTWQLVKGLSLDPGSLDSASLGFREVSPDSGKFTLFSIRRRKRRSGSPTPERS